MGDGIKQNLGMVGCGALGAASSIVAISGAGAASGLSATGIASSLATIGGALGGGMLAGLCVTVALPVAGCLAGVALVRTAKN